MKPEHARTLRYACMAVTAASLGAIAGKVAAVRDRDHAEECEVRQAAAERDYIYDALPWDRCEP